jgi:hypothetical protein
LDTTGLTVAKEARVVQTWIGRLQVKTRASGDSDAQRGNQQKVILGALAVSRGARDVRPTAASTSVRHHLRRSRTGRERVGRARCVVDVGDLQAICTRARAARGSSYELAGDTLTEYELIRHGRTGGDG